MDFHAFASDFQVSFSREANRYFFSPGRVNLIGEHTDYNGGHVFPCAITYGTYGAVSKRKDRLVRLFSKNFPEQGMIEFTLDELDYNRDHGWANYPKGMLQFLQKKGHHLTEGFDLLVSGNIPNGAGLSSSASLLMLTGEVVNKLYNFHIDRIDLIKAGKTVENEFIGVNSGIMDHFAVAMGKTNHAILLDCHTLNYDYVPLDLRHYKIIIMNTNKRRELADSKYNERRDECEHALRQLQGFINILSLGDLNIAQFDNFKHIIATDVLRRRARHAVTENERTLKAVKELKHGNLEAFGKLMNESHLSLRDDYEVTGIELDTLVEAAWKQPGVLGARMTGAGFGGCAVAIVEQSEIAQFIEQVAEIYQTKIGYDATFYVASIGDGVKELNVGAVR
ncbi:galactokinase [Bacillus sp. 1NLA3E]|uniref:galactokinase n=1 Tax=Bacillus sp. 1NLA3E TaxID=666686 RepID=UPI000247EB88|nr:galactokinase [Bacillus sp. 1NLA3E]AGK55761.1 galactokinase [Bacillus sp. 1NLA3E]